MKKVLLINGSPHEHGCTYTALKEMIDVFAANGVETELLYLGKQPIAGCIACGKCYESGRCIFNDKVNEIMDRIDEFDGIVLGSPVYYAGPAKTPAGMPCGSMGPTTAQRMDPYVDPFQAAGGSMIMIAKGNRSQQVTDACQKHGGFYLGSIGGPAALLAHENIKEIECVEYPELGMEAVWKIRVENFPAFILVDDKGNDFFKQLKPWTPCCK